jgi:inhibitor of cysteine peptidase
MIRKIKPAILFILLIITVAACSPSKSVVLTMADNGKQVNTKVGEQIIITLDGNPSTGYSWESSDLDTTIFKQVGDPVFQSSDPNLVGSGGTLTLTFEALKAGTATLALVYHRPWETGIDPLDTFSILVTVK